MDFQWVNEFNGKSGKSLQIPEEIVMLKSIGNTGSGFKKNWYPQHRGISKK